MMYYIRQILTVLLVWMLCSGLLWAQTTTTGGTDGASTYSAKVALELERLIRLAKNDLWKYFRSLQREERGAREKAGLSFIPASEGGTGGLDSDREVAREAFGLGGARSDYQTSRDAYLRLRSEIPKVYEEEVILLSLNVYIDKNKTGTANYLSKKIEGLSVGRFPNFSVFKDPAFFRYNYQDNGASYTFSYGPEDNQAITERMQSRDRKYYMRVYFFRLAERSILDINIYNTETHQVIWGNRYSVYIAFPEINVTYRLSAGIAIEPHSAIILNNFIGVRLPGIGMYGVFLTLGMIPYDATNSFNFNATISLTQIFVVIIGPQASFSLNELFFLNYGCCEVFVDVQLGFKSKVAISADVDYLTTEPTLAQSFVGIIGASFTMRRFIIYANVDVVSLVTGSYSLSVGGGVNF